MNDCKKEDLNLHPVKPYLGYWVLVDVEVKWSHRDSRGQKHFDDIELPVAYV